MGYCRDDAPISFFGMMIRVLTVDDHAVVLAGIAAMIANEEDMAVIAEAANGEEAIAQYNLHRPDVVLMDLRMPRLDGVSAIQRIRAADPAARIVALTTYEGDSDIHRALTSGACAYLIKDALVGDLIDTIRRAASGEGTIPPSVAAILASYSPSDELTDREVEVLRLVAKGMRNREIGIVLDRREGTIKALLKNIHAKLGVDDRTEAVTVGLRRGIIHLDD
jgi:two-component system, NarL family, response regulator